MNEIFYRSFLEELEKVGYAIGPIVAGLARIAGPTLGSMAIDGAARKAPAPRKTPTPKATTNPNGFVTR